MGPWIFNALNDQIFSSIREYQRVPYWMSMIDCLNMATVNDEQSGTIYEGLFNQVLQHQLYSQLIK